MTDRPGPDRPAAIAVIDLGKTNLKLVLVDPQTHRVVDAEMSENRPLDGPPYSHLDTAGIFDGLITGLRRASTRHTVTAIVPCTHGSTLAMVDPSRGPAEDGLVLPVMDYEADPPDAVKTAYAEMAPPFEEVFAPIHPGGLTLARQMLWQQQAWPDAFAKARAALLWPQYWAWRLTGAATTEVTSLGAQSHLWAARDGGFSTLARSRGWDRLFPAMRRAWEVAGPIRDDLASATGVAPGTPVLVGVHDSNANYYRYLAAGLNEVTLLSTGTWLITFNPAQPLDRLDPGRDTCSNTDVHGRPVASSRFMAGREYALVAGDAAGTPATGDDVARVVAAGAMALPSFTDTGGPCPGTGGQGRIVGTVPDDPAARAALATLYTALMTDRTLRAVGAGNDLVIDGGFAENPLYAGLVAALRPAARVRISTARDGPAIGAALLVDHPSRAAPVPLDLADARPTAVPGLDAYAERWKAMAAAS